MKVEDEVRIVTVLLARMATVGATAGILILFAAGCTGSQPDPDPSGMAFPTSTPTTVNVKSSPTQYSVPVEASLRNVALADITGSRAATVDGDPAAEITYISGIEQCGLLARIEVDETATAVTIGVYVGDYQPTGDVICASMNGTYRSLVKLNAPLGDREVIDRFTK